MNTPAPQHKKTKRRKARHLSVCINQGKYAVEQGSARFQEIHLLHHALPEVALEEVDSRSEFLGIGISAPVFISCMTGGSEDGFRANRNLALAAQQLRIPVGMGSFRVLLEHEEVLQHFQLKRFAPDVPLLGNIGGVQVRDLPHDRIAELCRKLEIDALVIHLNPGQELFQEGGDRDFRGIRDAIGRICDHTTLPVIVKETGFGIEPSLIPELLSLGVRYVDLAGAGGTDWIRVETAEAGAGIQAAAKEFEGWGIPTALLLAAIRVRYGNLYDGKLLASGGVRTGQDVAKSLALGASLTGIALPLIRKEAEGGFEMVAAALEGLIATIRSIMVLTASKTLSDLAKTPLWMDAAFSAEAHELAALKGRKHGST